MTGAPRIAFYGDDFTGSTDTLATLVEAGLKTVLFLGDIRGAERFGAL
ncbi:four-carbon acid sugar kinase family protein, partial [Herbaspirillum sp. HC18]